MSARARIAVIGGSGALGRGLVRRWAAAGHEVLVGSRDPGKAQATAAELGAAAGLGNEAAAAGAEIVVLAVPFASHAGILAAIAPHVAGKLVVDATVPLVPPKVTTVHLPEGGSAAARAQAALPGARVTAAFHNVSAHKLQADGPVDCDVLIFGDEPAARETVVGLARDLGLRGLHGGPLANAVAAEALTAVLIAINRRYKIQGAGIRITGLAEDAPG